MLSTKSSILCILEILQKYSDENHVLNATEIQKYLKKDYDLQMERKSIYRNISYLCEFGYQISIFEENRKGFYLAERLFENSEITLLVDAVASSKFIPVKETNELIRKLESLQSVHNSKLLTNSKLLKSNTKTLNRDIFYNIEILQEAINTKKKVQFTYCTYNFRKQLVPRRDEKYTINPYAIFCGNENYYLVCNYDKYDNLSNYRIDFIKDIEILDETAKVKAKNIDLEKYVQKSIYMFGSEIDKIELVCDNVILKDVIDKFGDNVVIKEHNENKFRAIINSSTDGIEFWVMQYLNYCEVLEPLDLRNSIKENLLKNIEKYKY